MKCRGKRYMYYMKYSAKYHVFPASFYVLSRKIDYLLAFGTVRPEQKGLAKRPSKRAYQKRPIVCLHECVYSTTGVTRT